MNIRSSAILFVILFGYVFASLTGIVSVTAEDLPAALFALGAGFSCKSFSKMHKDFQEFLTAMADNSDESQPFVFFNFSFLKAFFFNSSFLLTMFV